MFGTSAVPLEVRVKPVVAAFVTVPAKPTALAAAVRVVLL